MNSRASSLALPAARGSYNFILGIAGPYGSGSSSIADELRQAVIDWPSCHVESIHVASLIEHSYETITGRRVKSGVISNPKRRETQQKAGTDLRKIDPELVGKIIIAEIYQRGKKQEEKGLDQTSILIFLIDSLKNTHDIEVLRRVYGDEFYLIFVYADEKTRWRRMVDYKGWSEEDKSLFQKLDAVDSDEKRLNPKVGEAGQQVSDLGANADYYVVNDGNRDQLKRDGTRFLELLMGNGGNHPTFHERAMHLAFSASNTSSCLSRQVGAAIFDENGNVLGIGRNDVPKAKGGLYSLEDAADSRCYLVGDRYCNNYLYKQQRFSNLTDEILEKFNVARDELYGIISRSEFRDVAEYCRAVHAEMEAILSMTRNQHGSSVGTTMYVTTQPCHNCTKHILCAGIKKVFYIEPYPKSLAEQLHSDAIILNPRAGEQSEEKLSFVPYAGIAPRRFHDFFLMIDERKDKDGKMVIRSKLEKADAPRFAKKILRRSRAPRSPSEHPDSVTWNELKILDGLRPKLRRESPSAVAKKGNRKVQRHEGGAKR